MAETTLPSPQTANSPSVRRIVPRQFRLSRYFSAVCVIGIAIVIAVMYVLSNQSINRTLVKQESDQNVALARTMLNSLWPRYAPLAKRAHRVPPAELVDQLENVQLRQDIYRLTRQLNIVKVRIFTPNRQIVFSNWDNEIGAFRAGDLAIDRALADAAAARIAGKDVTPFLLRRIVDLTRGASLRANLALVRNNARLAARIAVALTRF